MDVWRITVATLRRWYIFVPLLALSGWAAYVAGEGVQPEYEVTASALLTPGSTGAPVPNPYGGLDQASAAVAIVLNSNDTRSSMADEGLVRDYVVASQARSTILSFSVRGETPDVAISTGERAIELAEEELGVRQTEAGLPRAAQYGLDVLAKPTVVSILYDGKTQVQAVVGVLGASVALLAALLFDDVVGLIKRRRPRWQRRVPSAEDQTGRNAPQSSGHDRPHTLRETTSV